MDHPLLNGKEETFFHGGVRVAKVYVSVDHNCEGCAFQKDAIERDDGGACISRPPSMAGCEGIRVNDKFTRAFIFERRDG